MVLQFVYPGGWIQWFYKWYILAWIRGEINDSITCTSWPG
jgi:hypothetical protein